MYATAGDGTKIWYEHVPGDHPVLVVHGFASDARRTWSDTGWLRALEGRGVVTVDLRGHGQSDRPGAGYSPDVMAADLLAVLDALELPTVDVVGYSMGGVLGWTLAGMPAPPEPGRVRRLVLGGITDRPVAARDLEAMSPDDHLRPCIDGMAGHRIEGDAPVPVLVAAGTRDEIAAGAAEFAKSIGAPYVPLPKRNHLTAISSRAFKQAALEFLSPDA